MESSERKIKSRRDWIKICEGLGSVSKTARKCGIARFILYRWLKRYKNKTEEEPNRQANQKVDELLRDFILLIRQDHHFGPQRIFTHLLREHQIKISTSTVWRVLNQATVKPLKRYRSPRKSKRYSRSISGDRVQIDVTKVRQRCYQFTAVDDCTRLRVLRLYTAKTAENAVKFLFEVLEAFPFPIQRIQFD
ncbi:MAG: hypothetical protein BGO67_04075 [Alphaproteobacteria bacterium 41-28]|nr:MAG: hypothetical protein BGO67_04075 [Alphaproteobacteria bacterium 41-28]